MFNKYPYDKVVVEKLLAKLPSYYKKSLASITDLPAVMGGGIIQTGRTQRAAKSFIYGNQLFSLPQYLNKRFADIAGIADEGKQKASLLSFVSSYRRDILGMGDISKGMPVAHNLGFGAFASVTGSAIDVDLREKMASYGNRMMPLQDLHAHYAMRAEAGYGFSGVTTKLYGNQEFTMPGRSIMGLIPGAGLAESATKFSTLADVEAIGGAAGPGTGNMVMRSSYTPTYMREVERVVASRTTGMAAGPERRAVEDQIRRSMFYNNIVAKGQVSTDPMMLGGAVKVRPGFLDSTFRWKHGELLFKRGDLLRSTQQLYGEAGEKKYSEIMNIISAKGALSRKQMVAIKAASMGTNRDLEALLEQGKTQEEAFGLLGKSVPKSARVQSALEDVGDTLRLRYYQKEAVQKVRTQNIKSLTETAGLVPKGIDVLFPATNKADIARSAAPAFDTLTEIMSQESTGVGDLLSKYQDITNAINEEMKAKGRAPMARVMRPNALFNRPFMLLPDQYAVSGGILNKMEGMISPVARQRMIAGTHPVLMNALRIEGVNDSGRVIKTGLQELAAMQSGGLLTMAHITAERAAGTRLPKGYLDVMAHNIGRPDMAGMAGSTLSPAEVELMQGIGPKEGVFNKALVAGNPLFDPNAESSTRRFLDLGESFKYQGQDVNKVALFNAKELQLMERPGGDIWSNALARSQHELIAARATGDRAAIGEAFSSFMGAHETLLGKEGPVYKGLLKPELGGARGLLTFMHPDVEAELARRFHEIPGQAYTLTSYSKAKEILGVDWSKEEMMEHVMSKEGIMLANLRYPALQSESGLAASRLAIIDTPLKKMLKHFGDTGHDAILTSTAASIMRQGDRDGDIENVIGEFYNHERVQGELRTMRLKQANVAQRIYATEKAALADKLGGTGSQYLNAKLGAENIRDVEPLDIAKQLAQKDVVASFFGNAALRAREGAIKQGLGIETATRISQSFAAIQSAAGIDIKKTSAMYSMDPLRLLFGMGAKPSERKAELTSILGEMQLDPIWGAEEAKRKDLIAEQMLGALDVGKSTMMDKLLGLGSSTSAADYVAAFTPTYSSKQVEQAAIPSGGIAEILRNVGGIKPTTAAPVSPGAMGGVAGAATQNEAYAASASEKAEARGAKFAEDTGSIMFDWMRGVGADLKEGKGWKSLLIGGAVLAGVGLSMRKPGNLTVISNSNRGEQTRPDGSYIKQQEAELPTIVPRRQSAARLMTDRQYNVMINMRDVRKQNASRKHMIDLGNMISGKYRQPAKVHVNINDDSRDVNYQQLFTNTYNRQMNMG